MPNNSTGMHVFPTEADSGDPKHSLAQCVNQSLTRYLSDLNGEEAARVYELVLAEVEKPLFEVIMRYCENNQSRASRVLGINRNTLRKKLEQYDIT